MAPASAQQPVSMSTEQIMKYRKAFQVKKRENVINIHLIIQKNLAKKEEKFYSAMNI
jgi:hypothetical protein